MYPVKKHVTVLMATYNDSKYIPGSIKSILNQTHKEFEFLIIDDGSSDNTDAVINKFKDSRIVYKKIPHTGLAGALNFGLNNSTGDWIARIDADDLNTSNRLEAQLSFQNQNPEYDVIGSRSAYFNAANRVQFIVESPSEDKEIKEILNLHNPINHSSVFFNKNKILSENGYDTVFEGYEDFELWHRMKNKLKFKILPEVLVYTRLRNDSMTGTASKKKIFSVLNSNASQELKNAGSKNRSKFWNNILFWLEYFYGSKNDSRKYYSKSIGLKNSLAYLTTFLTDNAFRSFVNLRLRYKLQTGIKVRNRCNKELEKLISL